MGLKFSSLKFYDNLQQTWYTVSDRDDKIDVPLNAFYSVLCIYFLYCAHTNFNLNDVIPDFCFKCRKLTVVSGLY